MNKDTGQTVYQQSLNLAGKASNKNNETKILAVKYINIL